MSTVGYRSDAQLSEYITKLTNDFHAENKQNHQVNLFH